MFRPRRSPRTFASPGEAIGDLVHERWAGRAGVTPEDLQAIGLGDLGALDDRDRAAVAYAAALAQGRFRRPIDADPADNARRHLTPEELAAVDAVARAMAVANLSANTVEALIGRLRGAKAGRVAHPNPERDV